MMNNRAVFKENFHMSPESFGEVFKLVEPYLRPKKDTRPTDKICPLEKFAVAMEYLASGSIQRHVASIYRISKQHFGTILDEVCVGIIKALQHEIPPLTRTEFLRIANEFNAFWNLPNCLGAIDGKHVAIKCPANAGSLFYNYKGFHSIVLMAITDANCKFVYIDVGAYGSEGDANVFASTKKGEQILKDELDLPLDANVGNEKLPYFFVADDAFPLGKRIMKPYVPRKPKRLEDDERVANYRISRARRCVENCFGIVCSKFLCLARTMFCSPNRAQNITSACCYLHNFLMRTNRAAYCPPKYSDFYDENGILILGEWRQNISENSLSTSTLLPTPGRPKEAGKIIREKLKSFVNSPLGSLPWQNEAAFVHDPLPR